MPDETPTPLTPARLSEIRARAEAATDGPWVAEEQLGNLVIRHPYGDSAMGWDFVGDSGVYQCDDPYDDCSLYAATADIDAAFIAAARQDVPDLLAEVDRLSAALDVALADARAGALEEAAEVLTKYATTTGPHNLVQVEDLISRAAEIREAQK